MDDVQNKRKSERYTTYEWPFTFHIETASDSLILGPVSLELLLIDIIHSSTQLTSSSKRAKANSYCRASSRNKKRKTKQTEMVA
jgi:hypothetical protein